MRAHALRASRLAEALRATPAEPRVLAALAIAALGALGFARVAEDYLTNDPLARWDVSFARWLSEHRETALVDLFRAITVAGSPAFTFAIAVVAALVFLRRRRLAEAGLLVLGVGGTELVNLVLKLAFQRSRPEVASVDLDTYSFPSGHAMVSTAAYGVFAALAWRPGRRAAFTAAAVVLVGAICFSRLYLGVHYLSDVLGGVSAGATCLALLLAAFWWRGSNG